jgi:DNA-binding phage protein
MDPDYEQISVELLKALRGQRSQVGFSRRLKYSSNVAYTWESKRRWPTASVAMWAVTRVGIDLQTQVGEFHPSTLDAPERFDLTTSQGVANFLDDLRGATPIKEVARRVGRDRFAVSRWLKGQSEPRLPEFLRMIEGTSLRLMDFLAILVEPSKLPSIYLRWRQLQRSRNLFFDQPWTQVVLLCLELADYRALPAHEDEWVARRTGLSVETVRSCIEALADTNQITRRARHWSQSEIRAITMQRTPEDVRKAKSWWAEVAIERFRNHAPGMFSHNLFTVTEADFERLQELHRSYYRAVRSLVADSAPGDRIVLATLSMLALSGRAQ